MTAKRSPKAGDLRSKTIAVGALDDATRQAMWSLFAQYYADVSKANFLRDLAEKNHVIVLRDVHDHSVQGFSTLKVLENTVAGRRFVAVFSGDTLVAREYWGQTALQRAFLSYVVRTKMRHPRKPVYWFLISKGYKTYLLLSRNFPEYWPRHDKATPPWQAAIIDVLARLKYPQAWRPELGILHFEQSEGRLKDDVAPLDASLTRYPDIRFFAERNPGHAQGDELCCIGRVDANLWVAYMSKWLRRTIGHTRLERTSRPDRCRESC